MASQTWTVSTAELRMALENMLPRRVLQLTRRPSAYRSTFALEELDVQLEDGTSLELMFKDLSPTALDESARAAKPAFLYDPQREIELYKGILANANLGTARCYGTIVEPRTERYWLFLERVRGVELYQVGDFAMWRRVAAWLANMHARFATLDDSQIPGRVIQYDAEYYARWLHRAREFTDARFLSHLAQQYERIVEQLGALPRTLIHGEFYASNVLIQQRRASLRVCPVDWEMAGWGTGLLDLAALTSGNWTEAEKRALALAYYTTRDLPMQLDAFLTALKRCRLHLALQWLGWSRHWSSPPEQRQDWLGEAEHLVEELGS